MVQYVFTPWRTRDELLAVRGQFYPQHTQNQKQQQQQQQQEKEEEIQEGEEKEKQKAVSRVSMWMHRGSCPHVVESTALLTAAVLSDKTLDVMMSSSYSVRAAYSAAFSRFVTGLLDSHQTAARKQSMYDVAKSVGLPATFVELRHQATHESLPSLSRLRVAAKKGLEWMWEYYWVGLGPVRAEESKLQEQIEGIYGKEDMTKKSKEERCKELLVRYLNEEDERRRRVLRAGIGAFEGRDRGLVVRLVDVVCGEGGLVGGKGLRRAVGLVRELEEDEVMEDVGGDEAEVKVEEGEGNEKGGEEDAETVREELGRVLEEAKEREEKGPSWALVDEGGWVSKPIGVV